MMRRAVARGRIFPRSYSTDRRYGRLSLKATTLYPLIWANADDQGRLSGDPEEIKYFACPNIDHITKADIPKILEELHKNSLINVYNTSQSVTIQMLDWWHVQRLQWAWPSRYPPPQGWEDKLRYKRGTKEVVTQNWPISGERSGEDDMVAQVSGEESSGESPGERPGEDSGETPKIPPLTIPSSKIETLRGKRRGRGNSPEDSGEVSGEIGKILPLTTPLEKEKEEEKGRGRGNIPGAPAGAPGGRSSPSLTDLSLLESLTSIFPNAFGRIPNSRELAQLRDFEKEISAAGGATAVQVYDAFKEACEQNKFSISYVRAILFGWLGVPRAPP